MNTNGLKRGLYCEVVLTCTGHGGRIFPCPVEAFLTVADGRSFSVTEAVRRAFGTLDVSGVGLVEAWNARWWKQRQHKNIW